MYPSWSGKSGPIGKEVVLGCILLPQLGNLQSAYMTVAERSLYGDILPFGLGVDLRESSAERVAKGTLFSRSFVQGWLANRKLE